MRLLLALTLSTLGVLAFSTDLFADAAKIPVLEFFLDEEKVHSRPMTMDEHKYWASLEVATEEIGEMSADISVASGTLASQSVHIAAMATEIAASAMSGDADELRDMETAIEEMTQAIELDAVVIEEQAEEMEDIAAVIEAAASKFEAEVRKNSKDLEYDDVRVQGHEDFIHFKRDSRIRSF